MSHRSVASLLLATVLCGAGAAAHADSYRDHGNRYGRDWHSDRGNRGHDSYYYRRYGDQDRWGGSQWRPRSDYGRDWRVGRDWRGNDWDDHWDRGRYRRWDDRRYYHYRPYYRDNYYDDRGGYDGGWLDLILTFPLY